MATDEPTIQERNRLVESHLSLVSNLVARYRGLDRDLREDLIQEGRLALLKAAERYRSGTGAAFQTYAFWSVAVAIAGAYRRERRGSTAELDVEAIIPDQRPSPHQRAESTLLDQVLREALCKLRDTDRQVLELRYGLSGEQPLTIAEVARRLDISSEGVRKCERRGLAALRSPVNHRELWDLAG